MEKKRIHVLLVEDNADEALMLKMYLEGRPEVIFTTEWAPTIASALIRLERGGVDAILLDLTMPDGHGPDVVRRIKAAAPNIGPIVYTGWPKADVEEEVKKAGAEAVLEKPSHPDKISERLRFAVAHRDIRKERDELLEILEQLGDVVYDVIEREDPPHPPSLPLLETPKE